MSNIPRGLTQGSLVWAWLASPQTGEIVRRPVVVIDNPIEIRSDDDLTVVAVSTKVPDPPPPEVIMLPWHPLGRVRTGLRMRCGAVCNWVEQVKPNDIDRVNGIVPADELREIILLVKKLNAQ